MRKTLTQESQPTPLERPSWAHRIPASWLQELDDDAAAGDIAPDLLRDVILPSQLLSSRDCLDVYHGMFAVRIEEALELRFPAVRAAAGEPRFSELCREYADAVAASEAPASEIEERFPDHVSRTVHLDASERAWIAELARVERAIDLADDALDSPVLALADLVALPRDEWHRARLVPVPSLQLESFEHAIDGAYEAWLRGDVPIAPKRHAQHLAIFRASGEHHGRIERLPVPRRAFALVRALCAGTPLRAAIDAGLAGRSRPEAQQRLFQWLCSWVACGMFQSIETR